MLILQIQRDAAAQGRAQGKCHGLAVVTTGISAARDGGVGVA